MTGENTAQYCGKIYEQQPISAHSSHKQTSVCSLTYTLLIGFTIQELSLTAESSALIIKSRLTS